MKIDGLPCPYCGKITFSTCHLDEPGNAYVECYNDSNEGGCGRPYVVYIPQPKPIARKLTDREREDIKYIYPWADTLNMED